MPRLILRNAHVDAFQDSDKAWPDTIDLEGFHYDRIGGLRGSGPNEYSSEQWTDWLARYRTFSPQPYTQLSTALAAAGHREMAEAIQFAGRERERDELWNRRHLGAWAWLTFLSVVSGYGIGLYTFRVLWWVLLLTILGAIVLRYSPNARRHGFLWRLGASLHRLLPVVELSKEFKVFFDNPPPQGDEPRNLNRFQTAYFAAQAIAGWVLGFFLLAAMGGLTQKG
jgi:hypothetical protein